jgi:hypothetical protein
MAYQCVATSVAGFIQQLAVGYIARGYYFYVSGKIPIDKNPTDTDAKIIGQYGIDVSKWTRCRQRKTGAAGMQYLRYRNQFIILATHGEHLFFEAETRNLRDIRIYPVRFMGYSISCRKHRNGGGFHPSVRIHPEVYQDLKGRFEKLALHRDVDALAAALRAIPFEPYAPVRDQIQCIVRAVNRRRKVAGLEQISPRIVIRQRKPVKPFVSLAA